MKNKKFLNTIVLGDSLALLAELEENSIDIVLTDPPYFLDKLDSNWDHTKVADKKNQQMVKSLPAGMKFDREQGKKFYNWYLQISAQLFRVLKPGGFFFSFSSPRLYHRMACAVDDSGFEIRDCFIWLYTQNQAKAMSLNHFIEKMDIPKEEREKLKAKIEGWKTPQIKSCFEPIVMGQKPTEGTFLQNMGKYSVGLMNSAQTIGENMYPANVVTTEIISEVIDKVFLVGKPTKVEKGDFNIHQTVKPLALCEYLIALTAYDRQAVILDPFSGSGTTAVAAKVLGRNFIGIDLNKEYVDIANRRLSEVGIKSGQKEIAIIQKQLNIFQQLA
jgi:DNA modification methylase